jgi:hypothetical protein
LKVLLQEQGFLLTDGDQKLLGDYFAVSACNPKDENEPAR